MHSKLSSVNEHGVFDAILNESYAEGDKDHITVITYGTTLQQN